METKPLVTAVIINRNGARFLPKLLDTIIKSFDEANLVGEVVIVDNNSTDESLSIIREYATKYSKFKIISLKRNVGFCLAVNIGVRQADGEYIAIMNSDVYCDPKWLSHVIEAFKSPRVGIVQPAIYWYQDPQKIQSLGLFADIAGNYKSNMWNANILLAAFGAVYVVRKEVFKSIGGLDPSYFMYGDELDLGLRTWLSGYIVRLEPKAKCYHWMGGSTPQSPFIQYLKMYLIRRNQLVTITKTFTGIDFVTSIILLFAINMLRILSKKANVYAILTAYSYLVKRFRNVLFKRRQFSKKKILNISKLRKWGLIRPILE